MERRLQGLGFCLLAAAFLALTACGEVTLPEAPSTAPFQAATVAIRQSGNAPVTITASSVSFSLDDSRTLRVSLALTSHARAPLTISVRGTLYAGDGSIIGDATGGQVAVRPGVPTTLLLTGPTPNGTIASALFEASIPVPLITPVANPAPESQLPAVTPPPG